MNAIPGVVYFAHLRMILMIAGLAISLPGAAASAEIGRPGNGICEREIRAAEQALGLPPQLLMAMGRVEAGREDRIWPWTLNLGGTARWFADKASAVAYMKDRLKSGRQNIDAGCLQLNIQWVARDLSPEQVLSPEVNTSVAATHLSRLYRRYGSWTRAVENYHSRRPANQKRYVCKVFREFTRLRFGKARQHRYCL